MDPVTVGAIGVGVVVAKEAVARASDFFGKLVNPLADRVGVSLADSFSAWRARNFVRTAEKTEHLLQARGQDAGAVRVHPRIGIVAIEQGSLTDDETLSDMWAGLLTSSATAEGNDESNLIFTDLLARLTSGQARILQLACQTAEKFCNKAGLVAAHMLLVPIEEIKAVTGVSDIHRLDRELDHLRALGLGDQKGFGLPMEEGTDRVGQANLTPSPLGLQLYAACMGGQNPKEHFKLTSSIEQATSELASRFSHLEAETRRAFIETILTLGRDKRTPSSDELEGMSRSELYNLCRNLSLPMPSATNFTLNSLLPALPTDGAREDEKEGALKELARAEAQLAEFKERYLLGN